MLAYVEFTYNDSVNRSIGMSPLHIMQGRGMHRVADLVEVLSRTQKSVDAKSFVDHMKEVHAKVKRQLEKSNVAYKSRVDRKIWLHSFAKGDLVYMHVRKERLLRGGEWRMCIDSSNINRKKVE